MTANVIHGDCLDVLRTLAPGSVDAIVTDPPARPVVWSYGGGVQSVALACLVAQAEVGSPDEIVFADTGRERSTTWSYTERYVMPMLARHGMTVQVAGHELATVDLYAKNGDILIPAFTETGKLPTFCSTEWKRRVVQRHLRRLGYGPKRPVEMWIGISVDEVGRAKPSPVAWITHSWPLLFERPTRRDECAGIIKRAGLPPAPRSRCWMCPNQTDAEWREMLDANDYADGLRAKALDEELRQRPDSLYLHRSRGALCQNALARTDEPTNDLFGGHDDCESGMCFI